MERVILLTGFGPFGGERINPSWEVAERFEGKRIGGTVVKTLKLPVHCNRAARQVMDTVERMRPAAVIGLGQAGRPAAVPAPEGGEKPPRKPKAGPEHPRRARENVATGGSGPA